MASQQGTEGLTAEQAAGTLYYQNDLAAIGYNPNEEHAVKMDNRFWALRNDLNIYEVEENYSSAPYLLIAYTDPDDGRPAMRTFGVVPDSDDYEFDYPDRGDQAAGPMPLPLMALPLRDGLIANMRRCPTAVLKPRCLQQTLRQVTLALPSRTDRAINGSIAGRIPGKCALQNALVLSDGRGFLLSQRTRYAARAGHRLALL